MIPKRALFYWSSHRPMSWLRSLGIATFKKFNPDWEVVLHQPAPGKMHPVHASDLWRYQELGERGGVYFDTDIIFFRPVPEELLKHDLVISVHPRHRFCNIGCLMSSPDNPFFQDVATKAILRYQDAIEHKFWDGQIIGTQLLQRMFIDNLKMELRDFDVNEFLEVLAKRYDIDVALLPYRFVTPYDSFSLNRLYNQVPFRPPENSIGVHWYAGDKFNSRPFEKRIDGDNYQQWECYLVQAIRVALESKGIQRPESGVVPG